MMLSIPNDVLYGIVKTKTLVIEKSTIIHDAGF
jgi:hypothetical protein